MENADTFGALPDLTGQTVVVTGATGFIGSRVREALMTAGAEVTAIVRSREGARAVGSGTRIAALKDTSAMTGALAGADALCHLAYDMRGGLAENLDTFEGVLAAAKAAGVGRIVHASSVVVYDDWPGQDLREDSPAESPGGGAYRQAKIAMETRLMSGDMSAAILQPTLVYGPKSAFWTDGLADMAARGIVLPDPAGVLNAVYVDDVAQAFARAVAVPGLGQERFLVSGPAPATWEDLLGGYAKMTGGEVLREAAEEMASALGPAPQPGEGVPLAARISAMGRRAIGHKRFEALAGAARGLKSAPKGPARPDHFLFDLMTAKGAVQIDKARETLGYSPRFGINEGLRATEPYLRARLAS